MTGFYRILFLLIFASELNAQVFESSNLPIIIIDTEGLTIVDEPKITARMRIIDNPGGQRNEVSANSFQYDGFIGIELRGQSSQQLFPKKGFGIETRDQEGDDLDISILGMPEESDWVIHSPYSDKSLIRNTLAYSLAGDFMVYAPRVRMAELVINGDYLGVILWTEKIKRDKNRVDINKLKSDENEGDDLTGGYIIKFDKGDPEEVGWESSYDPIPNGSQKTRFLYHYPKPRKITDPQKTYIRSYMDAFENALMSDEYTDPLLGYPHYINVESFVQTILINELTRNVDGYRLSTYMFKDKDSKGGKLTMGPTWDHNLSWGNVNYCHGAFISGWALDFNEVCPGDFWVNHVWWNRLMSDVHFRQKAKDTWSDLRKNILSTERILNKIDSLSNLLEESQVRNFIRWPVLGEYIWPNEFIGTSYNDEIAYLKNWIISRTEWLDDNFNNLTTTVQDISKVKNIQIYPNPTSGFINIESTIYLDRIEFYNFNGQLIANQNINQSTTRIDLRSIPYIGLLWYRLFISDGNIVTGKLNKYGL